MRATEMSAWVGTHLRWAEAAPGKCDSVASVTSSAPLPRGNKPAGYTWGQKTSQQEGMRSLLVCAIKLELCFTRSHTVYILSVFTYTGSVRDQECMSGRHASMCVQSTVSAKAITQRSCHTHRAELLWLLNWRSQKHKNANWTGYYRILFTRFQVLRTLRWSKIHLPRKWLSLCSFPRIINVVRDYGGGSGQCVHFRCFYISFNLKVLI